MEDYIIYNRSKNGTNLWDDLIDFDFYLASKISSKELLTQMIGRSSISVLSFTRFGDSCCTLDGNLTLGKSK